MASGIVSGSILAGLFERLVGASASCTTRDKGAAFLTSARDLYELEALTYLCINIPVNARPSRYAHCCYSDAKVTSAVGSVRVNAAPLDELGRGRGTVNWGADEMSSELDPARMAGLDSMRLLALPLASRHEETALFGISVSAADGAWETKKAHILGELRILAGYLHNHVLRTHGHDAESELLVSARELDCLKWAAAGKSAWEASVILGISERTVRFHLNAAREKLDCTTTTQAVAKAVSRHLISV